MNTYTYSLERLHTINLIVGGHWRGLRMGILERLGEEKGREKRCNFISISIKTLKILI